MWCQKRITCQDLLVRFGDGKHRFYLESVCANPVAKGDLCINCKHLLPQTKTQDVKTFPHGNVLSEYTEKSHIFDSQWYHKKVKTYGSPSEKDIELAMEAHRRAKSGKRTRSIKELLESLGGASHKVDTEMPKETPKHTALKVKRVYKKSEKKVEIVSTPLESKKQAESNPSILEKVIPLSIRYVESMDDPIEIAEIVRISLKKMVINGKTFWKESEGNRIYEYLGSCKKGEYLGNYDIESGEIVEECV
jgi:hypothetical protein